MALQDIANNRILVQMDDTVGNRKFRDFISDLVESLNTYQLVAEQVKNAFDLSTAVGAQLDLIGAMVNLTRQGFGDVDYRNYLGIQIDIYTAQNAPRENTIGNWTGTHNQILRIIRQFIGPTPGEFILLTPLPPYSFELILPASISLTYPQAQLLWRFICQSLYAGVLGYQEFPFPGDNFWGSDHGVVPNAGIWGSAHGIVAGAAVWGGIFSNIGC